MKVNEIITNEIIEEIKKGVAPWRLTWQNGTPENFVSHRKYSGVNVLLLALTKFNYPYFLTWNQIQNLGKQVKKGSRAKTIIFTSNIRKVNDEKEEKESYSVLRYYKVFKAEDVQGLEIPNTLKIISIDEKIKIAKFHLKNFFKRFPELKIRFQGQQPCFIPSILKILIPRLKIFESQNAYFETIFHEIGHFTGTILNRELSQQNEAYSKEELIAELFSCFVMNFLGLKPDLKNSSSYLEGWSRKFKENHNLIISASAHAQKAFNLFFNIKEDQKTEEGE